MPKTTQNQYQIDLGVFINNEFVWHTVKTFATIEAAYKGFKEYTNKQLRYTDRELMKVWNSGRLDIELRRGNRLLNWVGIYAREADKSADDTEQDKDKGKANKGKADKDKSGKARDSASTAHEVNGLLYRIRAVRTEAELKALADRLESLIPEGAPQFEVDMLGRAIEEQPDVIRYNRIRALLSAGYTDADIDEAERLLQDITHQSVAQAAAAVITKAWPSTADPHH